VGKEGGLLMGKDVPNYGLANLQKDGMGYGKDYGLIMVIVVKKRVCS
jgi:hypothetical protein